MKFIVTRRNFLSKSNVFPVKLHIQQKTHEFLKEFCVSPQDIVGDYIPISPGISHPALCLLFIFLSIPNSPQTIASIDCFQENPVLL